MKNYYYLLPFILYNASTRFIDKTAVVVDGLCYSYRQVYQDSLSFSVYLKAKQFTRGNRVLILSGNTYLTMVAFWGSLFSELVPCVVDGDLLHDALNYITMNIDPCIVVPKNASLDNYLSDFASEDFLFQNIENDLALMMHTSGSTGYPKGVMLSHRNVIAAIDSITHYLGLIESDVILSVLPMHFDYGLYQMLLAFKTGATLILEENALFPHYFAKKMNDYQVTVLPCVPLLAQLLYITAQQKSYDFSSVRILTNTGESLSYHHIQKMKQVFPFASIFSMYGLTECKRCSYVPPHRLEQKSESIGIPIPNLSMWIQDSAGNRVGPNIEGELVILGPTVMMGYWKDEIETSKKINITDDGKKILLSGDRAIMDSDGYFYFKGRKDYIVKFNGAKLNCHEYTKKLMSIKGINRAYLFMREITNLNQLIVCVELDVCVFETDFFKRMIISQFPAFQKPSHLYFSSQFPSLGNGKLDKHQLEKIALSCVSELKNEH